MSAGGRLASDFHTPNLAVDYDLVVIAGCPHVKDVLNERPCQIHTPLRFPGQVFSTNRFVSCLLANIELLWMSFTRHHVVEGFLDPEAAQRGP